MIDVGPDHDQVPADLAPELLDHLVILVRHENHFRVGVIQHVGKLRPAGPDVERHWHEASVHGSQEEPGCKETVIHHERNLVTRAESQLAELLTQPVRLPAKLLVGPIEARLRTQEVHRLRSALRHPVYQGTDRGNSDCRTCWIVHRVKTFYLNALG